MTELKVLDYPHKLIKEGKTKRLFIMFNGVKDSILSNSGKYGFGQTPKNGRNPSGT